MSNRSSSVVGAIMAFMIISVPVTRVLALGFRNPDQGAAATAQGNAFVAQADDATAIYYNPAGITQIQGTEIANGGDLIFPDSRLKDGPPGTEMTKRSLIPFLYGTTDFGIFGVHDSPWRFGIGVNVPFGNEAVYNQNGPFRYLLTSANLQVINIQPTVAFKFNDHFSLGAGLNIYDVNTELNSHIPVSPSLDGRFHFDGNGLAEGATAGLLWKITPQHSIGIAYHSPFTVNYVGHADVNIPGVIQQHSDATASMPFPQTIAGGYAFRPIPQWKLEADIEWTNWQPLRQLTLNAPGSQADGRSVPFYWMDSFLYEFGTQYDLNKHWKLRAGYIFSENSVPGSTYSPSVPDADRHVFSVGFGFNTGRFFLDALYQYTIAADRTVNNGTAADGTWLINNNAVMSTMGMKF
ncbi:MAG TPA: outer membrane protein transport protein [Verrucomicrobiae bacterium]|nr:outer membrane protein transport protein [Verrucomicrobiae bacterium]